VRLLVLTFYFPPDLSAGSFRIGALVHALRDKASPGSSIEVLTTTPNRYASFSKPAAPRESLAGIEVIRLRLPRHSGDIRGQSCAFFSYARQVLRYVARRDYDLVFATSSRLMTAALGARVARSKDLPLYLDIRDIFADTMHDLMSARISWLLDPLLSHLESWTVRSAVKTNLVSQGFKDYFEARYPTGNFSWFTNGVDDEFIRLNTMARKRSPAEPIEILCAGNIGAGQALNEIVPELARQLGVRARFTIVGDGGRRSVLETAVRGLSNVELRSPVSRDRLMEYYSSADVLFLHLGGHRAFEKVLPSKLFEYAALGKPILAGVGGYAAEFVREKIPNAAVFPPGDVTRAISALNSLSLVDSPRTEFVRNYHRKTISLAMADDIWGLKTG